MTRCLLTRTATIIASAGIGAFASPCKNTGNTNLIRDPRDPLLGTDAKDFGDLDWDGNTTGEVPLDRTGVTPRVDLDTVDIGAYGWSSGQQQSMVQPPGEGELTGPPEP